MLATAPTISTPVMSIPPIEYGHAPLDTGFAGQRQFKKHKVLPRPQNDRSLDIARRRPADQRLPPNTSSTLNTAPQASSSRVLKHHSKRIGNGPELPPTPPIQSRNSSGSHNTILSSSNTVEDQDQAQAKSLPDRPVITPPDQRSPPTPDITPPQPATKPRALRPTLAERNISRTTTGDSRTESFKTAREEPFSSGEEEDGKSTIRPGLSSGRTSQATVRRISDSKLQRAPQPHALGFALSRLSVSSEGTFTPKTKGEFGQFDGDWGTPSEVEQEWDDNLQRTVTVRKTSPSPRVSTSKRGKPVVVEANIVNPSNATKAARSLPLHDGVVVDQRKGSPHRRAASSAVSNAGSSTSRDSQQPRDTTTVSNASPVVGAILVDVSPQRRRTLRHVRKQRELRESVDLSPGSTVEVLPSQRPSRPPLQVLGGDERQRESFASTATTNSLASGRARREVWKSGAIPVVVVPDRRSSSKPKTSKEPSLRSTSSRRSRRTMSVSSVPRGGSLDNESATGSSGPVFERPSRRSRRFSESDRDERTIDFPPAIPARSSSLSAPTSRNNSRAGSMTAESVKARNALPRKAAAPSHEARLSSSSPDKAQTPEPAKLQIPEPQEPVLPDSTGSRQDLAVPEDSDPRRQYSHDKLSVDHLDDGVSTKKFSSRNTPFSAASIETNGTAPEVSEAMAVHMYPHQNSSLLMVDHSAKPSDTSDVAPQKRRELVGGIITQPKIVTTDPDGNGPATPPQLQFSLDDIDSPLRNPRSPPQPPAGPPVINFIPATPSGLTPAHDKMALMGNYFESMKEKPPRRPSIVRRALNKRRRHSLEYPPTASKPPGLLTRTFSLSRNVRRAFDPVMRDHLRPGMDDDVSYPPPEEVPVEENKLHPLWRPQSLAIDFDGFDSGYGHDDDDEVVYRYPPIDNRPGLPKRSLSERMKRTFAIFPIYDDVDGTSGIEGPERRTIRRTPSGNLRVVQRRLSADSLVRRHSLFGGQSAGPEGLLLKPLWQGRSVRRRASKERYRRFSIGSTLGDIQNLPQRLSERRRERRSRALREKISGPKEVRDGVEDMLRSTSHRDQQPPTGQI